MSKRKAYRVRQHQLREFYGEFRPEYTGHPYIAQPWPEDCPWDPEDFPLPGETVLDMEGYEYTVTGGPVKWWEVWLIPTQFGNDYPSHKDAEIFPAIWNARKDAKPEVVGTITVSHRDGFGTLEIPPLEPGRYKVIREEDA